MPRKAYVADLQEATCGVLPATISGLRAGDDDGTFVFLHKSPAEGSAPVTLQAMIPDVSSYPTDHSYFLYAISENAPEALNEIFNDQGTMFNGLRITAMLAEIADVLNNNISGAGGGDGGGDDSDEIMKDAESSDEYDSSFDRDQYGEPDLDSDLRLLTDREQNHAASVNPEKQKALKAGLQRDLRSVKAAGFRLCFYGQSADVGAKCYISVSCRAAKLDIQEDTLRAWNLNSNDYVILLISYPSGYRTLEQLTASDDFSRPDIVMKTVLGKNYKISYLEVVHLLHSEDTKRKKVEIEGTVAEEIHEEDTETRELFISRPLNDILNSRLIRILKYRMSYNLSWQGAEDYYSDHQGKNVKNASVGPEYYAEDTSRTVERLPSIAKSDHLVPYSSHPSFVLLAMQFTIRHLVRCTEFCLVCHCRVSSTFEALRPYVCSKPLCLYQYMSLGFGPSIDHEILFQPCVVDLLVSFCYYAAYYENLASRPVGLGLMVSPPCERGMPAGGLPVAYPGDAKSQYTEDELIPGNQVYSAEFDEENCKLYSNLDLEILTIRPGQWVTIFGPEARLHHRRVKEIWPDYFKLGPPVQPQALVNQSPNAPPVASVPVASNPAPRKPPGKNANKKSLSKVGFAIWNVNFDDLTSFEQQTTIISLLNILPSVKEMSDYLKSGRKSQAGLQSWGDRLPPAALELLRWIIASNRSCIVQVDSFEPKSPSPEARVYGMPGFMQFRFAQGAPDKEARFVEAVANTKDRQASKYPTIFAWHGSPLKNWHSIVREGLHFQKTLHGRAFGNGVYHALHATTSLGYTGMQNVVSSNDVAWPGSELTIEAALSLNEIVNVPTEFVSTNPHLVVSQLDWIQTRYLFVRCQSVGGLLNNAAKEVHPPHHLSQDKRRPYGISNEPIVIPINAVSKSRQPVTKAHRTSHSKKSKVEVSNNGVVDLSDDTDLEDRQILLSDDDTSKAPASKELSEPSKSQPPLKLKMVVRNVPSPTKAATDFVPGKLDQTDLPILAPPSYETPQASKALQRALNATLKTQQTEPLHELGWYLDAEVLGNLYQWIFELHSFDASLPLAQDMKAKGLRSIILELRFGKDYPYSPPFVRIVRPRFLSFMQGGGGHVTAGGAMCMELLTNSGWNPVSTVEAVLLQVRMALTSTEPQPARLEHGPVRDYGVAEAVEAFKRACRAHGWAIPADFASFAAAAAAAGSTATKTALPQAFVWE